MNSYRIGETSRGLNPEKIIPLLVLYLQVEKSDIIYQKRMVDHDDDWYYFTVKGKAYKFTERWIIAFALNLL